MEKLFLGNQTKMLVAMILAVNLTQELQAKFNPAKEYPGAQQKLKNAPKVDVYMDLTWTYYGKESKLVCNLEETRQKAGTLLEETRSHPEISPVKSKYFR